MMGNENLYHILWRLKNLIPQIVITWEYSKGYTNVTINLTHLKTITVLTGTGSTRHVITELKYMFY